MTLSELKSKDVVNTLDGRVTAMVVPGKFNLWDMLRGEKCGIVIPWGNICKIGDDVILVDMTGIC